MHQPLEMEKVVFKMMCAKVHFTHTECENRYENEVKMHKTFKKVSQMKACFK